VSWLIVVLVGAVPAAVLGLTAHLHALRAHTDPDPNARAPSESGPKSSRPESGPGSRTESGTRSRARSRPRKRPRPRTEDEILAAAREADAPHRQTHDGRPITRDALREALRISGARATELRRHLADTAPAPAGATPDVPDRKEAPTTP
jgi:hypothetical protein